MADQATPSNPIPKPRPQPRVSVTSGPQSGAANPPRVQGGQRGDQQMANPNLGPEAQAAAPVGPPGQGLDGPALSVAGNAPKLTSPAPRTVTVTRRTVPVR